MRSVRKQISNVVLASVAGLALAGGCSAALVSEVNSPAGATGTAPLPTENRSAPGDTGQAERSRAGPAEDGGLELLTPRKQSEKKVDDERLPSGVTTATSFWDARTASGKPMSYRTVASPYWPLGTKVKITHEGKSAVGVVDDFGPAEWAVAQHTPPAIIDLSEPMMKDLTGTRSNVEKVKFQVLDMGDGRTYRKAGTGYDAAMGR